jgi:hypothetical protein
VTRLFHDDGFVSFDFDCLRYRGPRGGDDPNDVLARIKQKPLRKIVELVGVAHVLVIYIDSSEFVLTMRAQPAERRLRRRKLLRVS